jgi:hypothetical protein
MIAAGRVIILFHLRGPCLSYWRRTINAKSDKSYYLRVEHLRHDILKKNAVTCFEAMRCEEER